MGFFSKLERMSEKYIEGFFKTKFADHIQPVEIAKLLLREMRDNKTVSVAATYVPNEYKVFLGKEDWEALSSFKGSFSRELQDFLKQKASERGYNMVGELKVSFEMDENLPLGKVSTKSSFSEELPSPKSREFTIVADRTKFCSTGSDNKPRAMLVYKTGAKEGTALSLDTDSTLIGRRRTNSICLDDNSVSRVHCEINCTDGCYYITDLGSTNGTYVNNNRISRKKLSEGDLIRMGTTILEFRVV